MTERLERPGFLPSFFGAMAERAESKTLWRMFVVPSLAAAAAAGVACFVPAAFWADARLDVATTVYTGILTFNGLILALSWSAFSRIHEMIGAPKFCAFLRRNGLLNKYIVTVSFIHGLQLFAVVASAVGLIALLLSVPYLIIDRILFGVMTFGSIWAVQQASTAVGIMHDLLWQKALFDEHNERNGSPNVVPMGGAQ